ncbi:MAG: AsmA-like C-terminal domain-containing protein, partial [Deltaproteobacteria bacterium]|nr:AsmA-like C-terminal domain-containing protein [Deltaproteobacteria bacterium]
MEQNIKTKNTVSALSALILILISLLLAGALYLLFIPVDLTRHHARIEALVEARTGLKVSIDSIVVKALPTTQISLKGVKAFEGGSAFLDARSVDIHSSPMGLLRKNPVLDSVYLDGAEIFVRRDPSGRINIKEFLLSQMATVKGLNLRNCALQLVDEFAGQESVFDITGMEGYMYEFRNAFIYRLTGVLQPGSKVAFSGKGELGTFSLSGTGSLRDIDVSKFNRYMVKGPEGVSVRGVADIDSSYAYDKKLFVKNVVRYRGIEVGHPWLLARPLKSPGGSASIEVLWRGDTVDLSVNDARLDMKDFSLSGSLKLSGPSAPPAARTLTLNLSTSRVPLKTFFGLIPVKAIPEEAASMIGGVTPIGGGLTVKGLTLNMELDDILKLDSLKKPGSIALDLLLDDVGFRVSGLDGAFSGISGLISLKERAVSFTGVAGRYNREVIESLKGRLSDLSGRLLYDLSIKGTADVDETLVLTRKLAHGRHEGIEKKLSMTRADGEADFTLGLKGSLKGGKEAEYSGSADLRNGSLSYEGFPIGFTSIAGGVDFDNKTIAFRDLAAKSDRSTLALNGRVDGYSGGSPVFDIKAAGDLYHETLHPFIKEGRAGAFFFDGPISFTAEAAGRPDAFAANASADAGKSSLEYKKLIKKAPGYPLALSGSGEFVKGTVEVKKGRIEFGKSSVEVAGKAVPGKAAYDFLANSRRLMLSDIDDISPFLSKDFESKGFASFSVNVSREPGEASPRYMGSLSVQDSSFRTTFLPKPIERINASAEFDGNRASARIENVSTGRTSLNGWVDITDIAGRVADFSLYSPGLYSEDLFPLTKGASGKAGGAQTAEALLASRPPAVTGTGRIIVRDGSAWGHGYSNLHASVYMGKDSIRIAPLDFTLDKGAVSGGIRIQRDPADPVLLTGDFKFSGLDIESMISGAGGKQEILSGRLRGGLSLTAGRGASPFTRGLNGKAALRAEDGRLWQFPILSRIFSIVNIVSINELLTEGLPYKTIYGDFNVKDGVIHTDGLLLDSRTMRMSAVGDINMPEGRIDSVLAIHPFVTIDKIISSIPLAGWIITGKEKSTVSMYFGIEGPLKEPDIYP